MRPSPAFIVATAVLVLAGAAEAASPTDARSCAVRYTALRNMTSYAFDKPDVLAKSKKFGQQAVAVLIKSGAIKAGDALPKDVSDDGAAYVRDWRDGKVADETVAADLSACNVAFGFPSLL
ncbi:MAG: hypothetical protein GC145_03345 [Caulobacter sp.]|nr:hypothetical protein [Caulobacter sp.]